MSSDPVRSPCDTAPRAFRRDTTPDTLPPLHDERIRLSPNAHPLWPGIVPEVPWVRRIPRAGARRSTRSERHFEDRLLGSCVKGAREVAHLLDDLFGLSVIGANPWC
jgi:hypothetical protein